MADDVKARYAALCEQRDATYAALADLQARLHAANEREQQARREALAIAKEISDRKGGMEWVMLKREIAQLARQIH